MSAHQDSPRRVVVTGVGAVTAAGQGAEPLWQALVRGEPLLSAVERFNGGRERRAGQVADFKPRDWMKPILVRQTDRSTHFAMAAFRLGIEAAGLDPGELDPQRTGLMVGHAIGGMDFGEPQMYNQKFHGPENVSTYQAIAWFYAAALGQISIAYGVKGYSKAFTADRVSGLHAIGHGFRAVAEGRIDVCVAGATEAPLVPFVYQAMDQTGRLSADRYLPFSPEASGFLLGEGACFLVLEDRDRAVERGAPVLAEIKGFALTNETGVGRYGLAGAARLGAAMERALTEAGGAPIDHVFADGAALPPDDLAEVHAIRQVLGADSQGPRVSVSKAVVGDLYGAGAAVEAAAAAYALSRQTSLPLAASGGNGRSRIPHYNEATEQRLRNALVNSRGNGGMSASLVLGVA